jgi:Mn2+/Fe2+ NRAMP family transporter
MVVINLILSDEGLGVAAIKPSFEQNSRIAAAAKVQCAFVLLGQPIKSVTFVLLGLALLLATRKSTAVGGVRAGVVLDGA